MCMSKESQTLTHNNVNQIFFLRKQHAIPSRRRKNIESKLVMCPLQNSSSLLTPKSDWHLISSYSISPESHIKVRRIKEMITTDRAHDC